MKQTKKSMPSVIDEYLGLPAFLVLGGLLWWQWPHIHWLAIRFFITVDRTMSIRGLPPLAVYALVGAVGALTVTLWKHDHKVIGNFWRWRAVTLPLGLGLLLWWLH